MEIKKTTRTTTTETVEEVREIPKREQPREGVQDSVLVYRRQREERQRQIPQPTLSRNHST